MIGAQSYDRRPRTGQIQKLWPLRRAKHSGVVFRVVAAAFWRHQCRCAGQRGHVGAGARATSTAGATGGLDALQRVTLALVSLPAATAWSMKLVTRRPAPPRARRGNAQLRASTVSCWDMKIWRSRTLPYAGHPAGRGCRLPGACAAASGRLQRITLAWSACPPPQPGRSAGRAWPFRPPAACRA